MTMSWMITWVSVIGHHFFIKQSILLEIIFLAQFMNLKDHIQKKITLELGFEPRISKKVVFETTAIPNYAILAE